MPVGLESRCKHILHQIVTVSQLIRSSALVHADNQSFAVSERLRCQLETIRTSADIVLEAITKASFSDDAIDDRIIDWLLSGEPYACLSRLKEMDDMLKPDGQSGSASTPAPPFRRAADKLTATMIFFNQHANLFQFLLAPDVRRSSEPPHGDAYDTTQAWTTRSNTPFAVTEARGYSSVAEHLVSCNDHVPPDSLHIALRSGSTLQMIEALIRNGASVHFATLGGDTVLHLAVAEYHDEPICLDLVKMFIAAGCSVITLNHGKQTVLDMAIERDYTSVVEYLLSCDVLLSPDILPVALQKRSTPRMIECLIHHGADVRFTTSDGDTALHLVLMHYQGPMCLNLVKIFVDAGCDSAARNSRGKTVFEVALDHDHASAVGQLRSCHVPFCPDILLIALLKRSSPQMIECLIDHGADVRLTTSSGNTVLHLMAAHYDESTYGALVRRLVPCDPHLTSCNSEMQTHFQFAFECGYTLVVEYLLGCNVPLPPDILATALQNDSTPQMVETLIRHGAEVRFTTSNGDSMLHLAVAAYDESTCLDVVHVLMEAGCNPTTPNGGQHTVLDIAIERGYTSVVEHLRARDVPVPSHILLTALQKRAPRSMIGHLIRHGADVHSTTSDGDTVLHLAVAEYDVETICLDLVKMLVEADCDAAASNDGGKTVLETAVERGYTSVVEYLRSCHVPFPPDVLPVALQKGSDSKMVECLVRHGADVHSTSSNGDTIHHLAIAKYSRSMCQYLLSMFAEAGCRPIVHNADGKTVLEAAIERGYTSVVEYVLSCDILLPSDILLFALQIQSALGMVACLVRHGADVLSTTANGDTALHLAVANYSAPMCLYLVHGLIKAGCDPTACNADGKTALETAVERDHASVVAYLLSSCHVALPPHILPAALQKRAGLQTVDRLVRHGADVHATTSDGDTALHLAIAHYRGPACLHVVDVLLRAGCDPTTSDARARTALEVAMARGEASVAERLLPRTALPPIELLSRALVAGCVPRVVRVLARASADELRGLSEPRWKALRGLAGASYAGKDRAWVDRHLDAGRRAKGTAR